MTRPTLILAALAALCAAPAASAGHVTRTATIACETPDQVLTFFEIGLRPPSEANRLEFFERLDALRSLNFCVTPPPGTRVTIARRDSPLVLEVRLETDGRRLYVLANSIEQEAP